MNILILTLLLNADPVPADTWPGFRGDGTNTTLASNLPWQWSPSENLAWRTPLPGYGQSSPVVWKEHVYVTAIDGAEKETLIVLAAEIVTGKVVWTKQFPAGKKGKNNPLMSRAAPTPVVDSQGVYAFFESGDVIALDHTGESRWQRSLANDYGEFKNNHGIGSSPTQTNEAMIILIDDAGPSYLIALEKQTGKNLWQTERSRRTSWTSPVIANYQNRPTVIVSSSGLLSVYDAMNGKELAALEGLVGNNIPSPVAWGDLVVLGAGENRMKPDLIASAKSNCCVKLMPNEGKLSLEIVWEGKKAISQHASPLIHKGHAYFVTRAGLVHCLDIATGEERYAKRLDNQCWATPIGAGDFIYFFGKDGVTTVLKAGSEFVKVASNNFWFEDDFIKRRDREREKAATILPKPPEGKGPGGGPLLPKEELDASRYSAVGDVVYGVAAVDRRFIVRTGTELLCIYEAKPSSPK